ncbi:MAG: DNA-processing protein DprA, partial [Clostridiales bacterium]|nr:DNA-processing protein DprA [Clostridiales bacterium]
MNETELKNMEYSAIRFSGTITGNTVKELMAKGIISSHLDLTGEGFEKLYKDRDSLELTNGARAKIEQMYEARGKIKELKRTYIETAEENDISVISCEDDDYPFVWRNLTGMPKVFFIRGNRNLLRECYLRGAAGVVGSRHPGKYALYATEDFVREFSKEGIVTVSGMALGIDRKAHESSLDNYGKTIAILAGGPDNVYPPDNQDLYERLCDKGLILSEMPPGQQAVKQYFPSRNRLISALSDVCLVMQAGQFSGTLHTASFAASQGKDVFVLPN